MKTAGRTASIGLSLLLLWWTPASAQEAAEAGPDTLDWTVGAWVGFSALSDELEPVGMTLDSSALLFGVRVGRRLTERWEIEGAWGYGSLTAGSEEETDEIDGDLHVYHALASYRIPAHGRVRLRLSGGVGGMRYAYDPFRRRNEAGDVVRLIDTSWANELVLLFGIGGELDVGRRLALRVDAREQLQFCSAEDTPINETEDFSHCPTESSRLSNPYVSLGASIRF